MLVSFGIKGRRRGVVKSSNQLLLLISARIFEIVQNMKGGGGEGNY